MKFNFSIYNTLSIEMDIFEMEDYYGYGSESSHLYITFKAESGFDFITIKRYAWVDNKELICFVNDLPSLEKSILEDLSWNELMVIKKLERDSYQINISYDNQRLNSNMNFNFSADLTRDELSVFQSRFKEFLEYYNIM